MSRGSMARLALLAILWGSSFLWIKVALRGFDPVQIVLIRLALGAAVLIPLALVRRERFPTDRETWRHLVIAALVANAIPYVLFGIGERTTGSNVAGLLNATTPLWTVLVGLLVGTDRRVGVRQAAGLALGLAGTVLIFAPWAGDSESIASWGGIACLSAAFSYGISYVYMARYLTGRGISPLVLSASQLVAATGWLVIAVPIAGRSAVHWRSDAMAAIIILGVFGTGFAYVINYRLITDVGPATASITTYVLPVVATVLGVVVLDEELTGYMVGGILFILSGVGLARRP